MIASSYHFKSVVVEKHLDSYANPFGYRSPQDAGTDYGYQVAAVRNDGSKVHEKFAIFVAKSDGWIGLEKYKSVAP